MAGLLLKDLLSLKKQAIAYGAVAVFYVFLAIADGNAMFFGWMLVLLSIMMPLTAVAFDERAKWDKYALTMPVSRTQLVLSKYILSYILIGIAVTIYIVFSALYGMNIFAKESLLLYAAMIGIAVFFISLLMPAIVKFGTEKARIYMLAIVMVPTLLVMMIAKSGVPMPSEQTLMHIAYALPVVILLLAVGSILLSISIFKRKEL